MLRGSVAAASSAANATHTARRIARCLIVIARHHTGSSNVATGGTARLSVDILHQAYAVERALKAFESSLLEGHLSSCVPTGFKEGRDEEMIRELSGLFQLARK